MFNNKNIDIVFCRYNESINSIMNVIDYLNTSVYVYDRGEPKLNLPKYKNVFHIHDQNRGREEAAYLRHIIDNYNKLPEIIVFSQADYGDNYTHVYYENNNKPEKNLKKFIKWINTLKPGVKYNSYIKNVHCDCFVCPPSNDCKYAKSPLQGKHKVWDILCPEIPKPNVWNWYSQAIFATSGSAIRKIDISKYKKVYELTISNSLEDKSLGIPWVMERLWETIFTK